MFIASILKLPARAVVLAITGAALLFASDQDELRKAQERLAAAEAKFEVLRRVVPPTFDAAETEAWIRQRAAPAGLTSLEVKPERLALEEGRSSRIALHAITVSAQDRYQAISSLLRYLAIGSPGFRMETLHLQAAGGGKVRFTGRTIFPEILEERDPAPPVRQDLVGVLRERAARYESLVSELAAFLHPAHTSATTALAKLGDELDEVPVALTEVRLENELTLRGVLAGAPARAALMRSLPNANLRVLKQDFSPAGRCQAFTVIASLNPAELPEEPIVDRGLFDDGTAHICTPELEPQIEAIRVRGAATRPQERATALRLRDVDLVDVFFVLNNLINENFIVDNTVRGRVTLEVFEGATVEETLEAIGSRVAIGPAPLRHVTRSTPASGPSGDQQGDRASFVIRNAELPRVLCLLGDISTRPIHIPGDLRGGISIFAYEVGIKDLFDRVVASTGLHKSADSDRVVLGDGATAVNACEIESSAPSSRLSRMASSPAEHGGADLELAGLARVGDSWRAYVYGPARRLMPIEAGQRLFDATVTSIDADGVHLTSDGGGAVELRFRSED